MSGAFFCRGLPWRTPTVNPTVFIVLTILVFQAFSKDAPIPEGYGLLLSVQSPVDLILPHLPSTYTASVSLTGTAADEMNRMLEKLKLDSVRYEEVFDSRHRFFLNVANPDYPLETRECISGILNPVEMMDIVISSALKYRDKALFLQMVKETKISITVESSMQSKNYRIELVPRGKYFSYSYQDAGVFARETWLTGLTLVMDSASHRVGELVVKKYARQFDASQTQRPTMDSLITRYLFGYKDFGGIVLPTELTLSVNGIATLCVEASYRSLENKYTVFDSRKICTFDSSETACLSMYYGAYRVHAVPLAIRKPTKPAAYAKSLEKAAALSQEAIKFLREGNIESAIRICRKIISQCPETPQAVEARRLLSGLPCGK